jgi:hypothetical protein
MRLPFGISLALPAALFTIVSTSGCGHEDRPSAAEGIQGNWACDRVIREGEFDRTDKATLEILNASIRYSYDTHWDCALTVPAPDGSETPDCAAEPPKGRQGYFEGTFSMDGDSLDAKDASDTLSYRNLQADSFEFVVNGMAYPMKRN